MSHFQDFPGKDNVVALRISFNNCFNFNFCPMHHIRLSKARAGGRLKSITLNLCSVANNIILSLQMFKVVVLNMWAVTLWVSNDPFKGVS